MDGVRFFLTEFLSFINGHSAEHLLGGAVCVRRMSGIPLGL
jgi:hypothetical protein